MLVLIVQMSDCVCEATVTAAFQLAAQQHSVSANVFACLPLHHLRVKQHTHSDMAAA